MQEEDPKFKKVEQGTQSAEGRFRARLLQEAYFEGTLEYGKFKGLFTGEYPEGIYVIDKPIEFEGKLVGKFKGKFKDSFFIGSYQALAQDNTNQLQNYFDNKLTFDKPLRQYHLAENGKAGYYIDGKALNKILQDPNELFIIRVLPSIVDTNGKFHLLSSVKDNFLSSAYQNNIVFRSNLNYYMNGLTDFNFKYKLLTNDNAFTRKFIKYNVDNFSKMYLEMLLSYQSTIDKRKFTNAIYKSYGDILIRTLMEKAIPLSGVDFENIKPQLDTEGILAKDRLNTLMRFVQTSILTQSDIDLLKISNLLIRSIRFNRETSSIILINLLPREVCMDIINDPKKYQIFKGTFGYTINKVISDNLYSIIPLYQSINFANPDNALRFLKDVIEAGTINNADARAIYAGIEKTEHRLAIINTEDEKFLKTLLNDQKDCPKILRDLDRSKQPIKENVRKFISERFKSILELEHFEVIDARSNPSKGKSIFQKIGDGISRIKDSKVSQDNTLEFTFKTKDGTAKTISADYLAESIERGKFIDPCGGGVVHFSAGRGACTTSLNAKRPKMAILNPNDLDAFARKAMEVVKSQAAETAKNKVSEEIESKVKLGGVKPGIGTNGKSSLLTVGMISNLMTLGHLLQAMKSGDDKRMTIMMTQLMIVYSANRILTTVLPKAGAQFTFPLISILISNGMNIADIVNLARTLKHTTPLEKEQITVILGLRAIAIASDFAIAGAFAAGVSTAGPIGLVAAVTLMGIESLVNNHYEVKNFERFISLDKNFGWYNFFARNIFTSIPNQELEKYNIMLRIATILTSTLNAEIAVGSKECRLSSYPVTDITHQSYKEERSITDPNHPSHNAYHTRQQKEWVEISKNIKELLNTVKQRIILTATENPQKLTESQRKERYYFARKPINKKQYDELARLPLDFPPEKIRKPLPTNTLITALNDTLVQNFLEYCFQAFEIGKNAEIKSERNCVSKKNNNYQKEKNQKITDYKDLITNTNNQEICITSINLEIKKNSQQEFPKSTITTCENAYVVKNKNPNPIIDCISMNGKENIVRTEFPNNPLDLNLNGGKLDVIGPEKAKTTIILSGEVSGGKIEINGGGDISMNNVSNNELSVYLSKQNNTPYEALLIMGANSVIGTKNAKISYYYKEEGQKSKLESLNTNGGNSKVNLNLQTTNFNLILNSGDTATVENKIPDVIMIRVGGEKRKIEINFKNPENLKKDQVIILIDENRKNIDFTSGLKHYNNSLSFDVEEMPVQIQGINKIMFIMNDAMIQPLYEEPNKKELQEVNVEYGLVSIIPKKDENFENFKKRVGNFKVSNIKCATSGVWNENHVIKVDKNNNIIDNYDKKAKHIHVLIDDADAVIKYDKERYFNVSNSNHKNIVFDFTQHEKQVQLPLQLKYFSKDAAIYSIKDFYGNEYSSITFLNFNKEVGKPMYPYKIVLKRKGEQNIVLCPNVMKEGVYDEIDYKIDSSNILDTEATKLLESTATMPSKFILDSFVSGINIPNMASTGIKFSKSGKHLVILGKNQNGENMVFLITDYTDIIAKNNENKDYLFDIYAEGIKVKSLKIAAEEWHQTMPELEGVILQEIKNSVFYYNYEKDMNLYHNYDLKDEIIGIIPLDEYRISDISLKDENEYSKKTFKALKCLEIKLIDEKTSTSSTLKIHGYVSDVDINSRNQIALKFGSKIVNLPAFINETTDFTKLPEEITQHFITNIITHNSLQQNTLNKDNNILNDLMQIYHQADGGQTNPNTKNTNPSNNYLINGSIMGGGIGASMWVLWKILSKSAYLPVQNPTLRQTLPKDVLGLFISTLVAGGLGYGANQAWQHFSNKNENNNQQNVKEEDTNYGLEEGEEDEYYDLVGEEEEEEYKYYDAVENNTITIEDNAEIEEYKYYDAVENNTITIEDNAEIDNNTIEEKKKSLTFQAKYINGKNGKARHMHHYNFPTNQGVPSSATSNNFNSPLLAIFKGCDSFLSYFSRIAVQTTQNLFTNEYILPPIDDSTPTADYTKPVRIEISNEKGDKITKEPNGKTLISAEGKKYKHILSLNPAKELAQRVSINYKEGEDFNLKRTLNTNTEIFTIHTNPKYANCLDSSSIEDVEFPAPCPSVEEYMPNNTNKNIVGGSDNADRTDYAAQKSPASTVDIMKSFTNSLQSGLLYNIIHKITKNTIYSKEMRGVFDVGIKTAINYLRSDISLQSYYQDIINAISIGIARNFPDLDSKVIETVASVISFSITYIAPTCYGGMAVMPLLATNYAGAKFSEKIIDLIPDVIAQLPLEKQDTFNTLINSFNYYLERTSSYITYPISNMFGFGKNNDEKDLLLSSRNGQSWMSLNDDKNYQRTPTTNNYSRDKAIEGISFY